MKSWIPFAIIVAVDVSYGQSPNLRVPHLSLKSLPPCNITLRHRAVLVGKDEIPYFGATTNQWDLVPISEKDPHDSFFCHEFRNIKGFKLNYYLASIKSPKGHLCFTSSGDDKVTDREFGWFFPASNPFDSIIKGHFCVLDIAKSFKLLVKKGTHLPSEYKSYALEIDPNNCKDEKGNTR